TTARRCQPSPQAKAQAQRKARAHAKAEATRQADIDQVNALPIRNRTAAGIDVGKTSHWVCVGFTTEPHSDLILEFPPSTDGLYQLVAFLPQHEVTTVALEPSGHYWIVLYELLDSDGFEVLLVDPSYTKQIKGRPKTDRRDCQWIYRLHTVGLLAAAFRPD